MNYITSDEALFHSLKEIISLKIPELPDENRQEINKRFNTILKTFEIYKNKEKDIKNDGIFRYSMVSLYDEIRWCLKLPPLSDTIKNILIDTILQNISQCPLHRKIDIYQRYDNIYLLNESQLKDLNFNTTNIIMFHDLENSGWTCQGTIHSRIKLTDPIWKIYFSNQKIIKSVTIWEITYLFYKPEELKYSRISLT